MKAREIIMGLKHLICTVLLVAPVLSAQAEVYRYVDKQGNQVFTDKPAEGAEKVQTGPVMTVPFPKTGGASTNPSVVQQRPVAKTYTVTLLSPPAETVYRRGDGEVPVAATVSPSLAAGDELQILLDGKPWQGSVIPLDDTLERGSHTLQARVVDEKGAVLATSAAVSFHVQQNSSQGPTAPKPKPRS